MTTSAIPEDDFSEETLSHLKPQQGLSERYQRRAQDVTLACKLTHVYGKYHQAMLHRELAMSEERTTYQQAERQASMMNQMTIFHSSPSDFLHTQEESTDESIDTYLVYKRMVEEYSDEQFVPSVVEQFCKMVYEDDDHFIFFKPFCNLYFSVYADALLWYQQGKIGYKDFCWLFQELSWMDGSRTPLNGRRLKMYIMSMREVVEAYKNVVWYSDKEITAKKTYFCLKNLEVSEIMPIFAARMRVAYRRDDIKLRNRSLYTKPLVEYLRL